MTTQITYYLQFSNTQNRLIIDTKLSNDCELKESTIASSWIQAKYNFGYPLTSFQEYLLNQ
jgi:hypothetical protein